MSEPTNYEISVLQLAYDAKDDNGCTIAKLRRAMWLISRIYEDLPSHRDWLDPNYEREMKLMYDIEESDRQRRAQEKRDQEEWEWQMKMDKIEQNHDFLGEREQEEQE